MVSQLLKPKVYWGYGIPESDLFSSDLVPLYKDLKNNYGDQDVFKCPVYLNHIKNAYVYHAPFNVELKWEDDAWFIRGINTVEMEFKLPERFENWIQIDDLPGFGLNFFADRKNTKLTMTPPYLHANSMAGVAGVFDVGSWFRTVVPTFFKLDKTTFRINKGDPIMYIFFDKPVSLRRFQVTQEIADMRDRCISVKFWLQQKSMKDLYTMFIAKKYDKKLLKLLKEAAYE